MRARVDAGDDRGQWWWSRIIPIQSGAHQVDHMHAHSAAYPALSVAGMSESRRAPYRSTSVRDVVMRGRGIMARANGEAVEAAEVNGRPRCKS